jgi:hypothetical protein
MKPTAPPRNKFSVFATHPAVAYLFLVRRMRARTFALLLLLSVAPAIPAEEYIFQYHRFGHISLQTDRGKERIVILAYSKTPGDETTIFDSPLKRSGADTYVTPKGTVFTLKHLTAPIINDGNRRINSGDWQLTVSGTGKEFAKLKPNLPKVAFGDTPLFVYLGEKAE